MSNVSVILCVPHLIKDNCYSNIDTVTEPMQCNYSTSMSVVITNKFGAYKRVEEKNESQRVSVKMVDNNIYNVEFVDSIQQNQMIGDTPNYCIPLKINAITVQGISYSDPYFSSFNLNYKMALGAPEYMNKSDYAFKSSVCIIQDEPCTDKTLLKHMSAHKMICKTNTRINMSYDKSLETDHDNKVKHVSIETPKQPHKVKTFANGELTFDAMVELLDKENEILIELRKTEGANSWGVPRRLRLVGGGESSLNAASGWGSPPASNNAANWGGNSSGQTNNGTNNTQQWNNTQRPPTSQADSTNNAANANGNGANPASTNGPSSNGSNGNSNNNSSAKIEQLNSMREALYSQDGWGGQHVNQDTNWDVPGSPEPGSKVEPATAGAQPAWKPSINNGAFLGTDLWEANLRNGGQPPPQPASKTPWGHTPTTNIGGTWGEDDDAADTGNVWTGAPPPQQWPAGPPQHTQQWAVPKKDDWNAWGEPHRPSDPRLDPHRTPDPRQQPADPRHDLRGGISGRLNGDMWSQHHQHPSGPNKMMPASSVNQWGAQGPKEPIKSSGWEEPSPPAARRTGTGFDDGTSLWQRGMGGMSRGAPQGPPASQRIAPAPTKPDAVWGAHSQRNGSWEEPHATGWGERDVPAWPDASGPALWPVPKPKPSGPAAWPDDIGEWGGPKPPQSAMPHGKQLPKEMVWNSKQFRYLVELGYKKEDVEAALRSRDMNAEEALEALVAARGDGWRRDDHFHHGPFQPQPTVPSVPPAVVQKLLNQPPPPSVQHHPSYNPNSGTGSSGQPSTAQLRMLVQQIQMAVSAGYLNHQILNQPLAPQTLVLLNQLLQQIKVLQHLVQQHTLAIPKPNSSVAMQFSMQITKAKQQITGLQNQIANQQALYMQKQQTGGSDLFKQSHDPLAPLHNNFSDLNIKDSQSAYGPGNQQSRLTQWKLPSLDKDGEGTDFSRAPGTAKSATSPQLGQIGLQPESTWGMGRASEGWGDSGADVADGKDTWPSHATHPPAYDLVPEFEPGKPWKGNQMKNVEDDPAMTPGSVRSPLSLPSSIKDTDMLGGKTSPPGGERSLSSSTWSYAPPATSAGALKPMDAWSAKPRPAPPGLAKWPQHHVNSRPVTSWQASTWLLLKNLTAQIDGSTLKTLCLQHGPLQNFHLYLNQGLALARYATREEAAKAQMALNNCVLSNTTIFAESPAESEVQMILQHLGQGGGGAWRGGGGGAKDGWGGGFPGLWPEQHEQRATPSSLNSFLPPDLLGGESI
ncbi:protein Gawky isoform X3 [Maniola jurtina]|uniref:protein Gawky isoform X3 n=1 Tax=Maniola jurtina TaxID=191418 RepID=UPI001E689F38|nr:protein Gawky isoform X3 [Maniola jurtina]